MGRHTIPATFGDFKVLTRQVPAPISREAEGGRLLPWEGSCMSSTRLQAAACSALVLTLTALATGPGFAQSAAPAAAGNPESQAVLRGKLERIKVHGKSLEGNLMGESASPEVSDLSASQLCDRAESPVSGRLSAARIHWHGSELLRADWPPAPRHRGARVRQGCRTRDDSRDAQRHERVRRQHVLQFRDRRRLGGLRR